MKRRLYNFYCAFCDVWYDCCDRTRLDELVLPILALLVLLLSGALYWTRTHQPAAADRLPPRVKWTLDHGYLYVRRLGPTN